jgi:hypothetical protein
MLLQDLLVLLPNNWRLLCQGRVHSTCLPWQTLFIPFFVEYVLYRNVCVCVCVCVCVLHKFRCVVHCAAVTCLTEILQATSAILASFLLRLLRCRADIANVKNVSVVSVCPFSRQVLSDNRGADKRGHMNYDIVEYKLFCR